MQSKATYGQKPVEPAAFSLTLQSQQLPAHSSAPKTAYSSTTARLKTLYGATSIKPAGFVPSPPKPQMPISPQKPSLPQLNFSKAKQNAPAGNPPATTARLRRHKKYDLGTFESQDTKPSLGHSYLSPLAQQPPQLQQLMATKSNATQRIQQDDQLFIGNANSHSDKNPSHNQWKSSTQYGANGSFTARTGGTTIATASAAAEPLTARQPTKPSGPPPQQLTTSTSGHQMYSSVEQYPPANSPTSPMSPSDSANAVRMSMEGAEDTSTPILPLPMTPAVALKHFYHKITPFEQSEILELTEIYFVGNTTKKIRGIPHTALNNGYDDDRGDYKIVMHDHIGYRYEVLASLGRGSFGQVVKVMDHKTKTIAALKLVRNKKRFHHQALVEVKILEHIANKDREDHTNIIHLTNFFYFRNHLCITFDCLNVNLYEFIKGNNFKGLSLSLIRRFTVQLLHSLKFLEKERIIHCDLKPENVLLVCPNKSNIKLIDFGSSCFDNECIYTYIQSRFYRAPEVILGQPYGLPIDMWSLGCILSELYTGNPIFPGENETEQIQCMMEVLGVPSPELIDMASRKHKFFDEQGTPKITPNSRGKVRRPGAKDLHSATKCNDPHFIDFLARCLDWNPKTRLAPGEALLHPFVLEPAAHPVKPLTGERERDVQSRAKGHLQQHVQPPSLSMKAKLEGQTASLPPIHGHGVGLPSESHFSTFELGE